MMKFLFVKPSLWFAFGVAVVCLLALPSGIYLGGDWVTPATPFQLSQYFSTYVWSSNVNFGQPWLAGPLGLLYGLFLLMANSLGVPIESLGHFTLTFIFSLAAFNFYRMARYFELKIIPSLIGGLLYITTPVFFNYTVMGWQYALFAIALLPLAAHWFCQTINQKSNFYAFGVAIVWSMGMLQSQSLIWFPLVFIALGFYLISDWNSAKVVFKKSLIIIILFIGMNAYWWLAIILFHDDNFTSSAIIVSEVSLGADYYFTASNALRLWGSLFNRQYEASMSTRFMLISWILTIFAILSILIVKGKNKKLAATMFLIAFVLPVLLFILKNQRDLMVYIPGAGLIRQLSRFTVLTAFAYVLLAVFFLNSLLSSEKYFLKNIIYPISLVLLFLSVWPWWMGKLTNYSEFERSPAFPFRTKEFPADYYAAEKYLSTIGFASRSFYFPYGLGASYKDDPDYHGMFWEGNDIFASYSPIPGAFMPTDRPSIISEYMTSIQSSIDPVFATRLAPVNFYVLRKNIEPGPLDKLFKNPQSFFPLESFDLLWNSKNISIYARKYPLPLIYSPTLPDQIDYGLNVTGLIARRIDIKPGGAFVLDKQNLLKSSTVKQFLSTKNRPVSLEYRKINPTKYRIRLHNVSGKIPLIFGESYSRGWRLYPIENFPTVNIKYPAIKFTNETHNELYKANVSQINDFFNQGLISQVGVGFISNIFSGTIQNDNLIEGSISDTWHSKSLFATQHLMVNGYANGWLLDTTQVCATSKICQRNADGSFDLDVVIEFWPQQLFYIGLAITFLSYFIGFLMLTIEYKILKRN
jgi:hypothetical protein